MRPVIFLQPPLGGGVKTPQLRVDTPPQLGVFFGCFLMFLMLICALGGGGYRQNIVYTAPPIPEKLPKKVILLPK